MGALDYIPHYTYDDYAVWEGDWELFEGVPVAMSPAPMVSHQAIAYAFARALGNSADACDDCLVLGEVDYRLADDTVFRPDVVLICNEPHDVYITKAPEIIVEVVSPSTQKRDEEYKLRRYEAAGVKYYLLVYPDTLIAVIFKLIDVRYEKVGEFSTETYAFDTTTCKAAIDFGKVFKRFGK